MDTVPSGHPGRVPPVVAFWAGCLAALLAGCAAGRVVDGAYENSATGFRIPVPAAPWVPITIPDVEVAFQHPPAAATIAAVSTCEGSRRAPLRILARRLFFGLKGRQMLEQAPVSLDGAEALRSVVRGEQDGTPVVVESVVVRRGTCVYDLILAARPGSYAAVRPDFERLVAGWRPLPSNR